MTLEPVGTVARPLSAIPARTNTKFRAHFTLPCSPSLFRRRRLRRHLDPPAWTVLDIWVVTFWILAIIPVILLRLLRLDIRRGLLLDNYRG